MKKVLILGANSYIGNSFQKYIGENYNDQYEVHKVSLRCEAWKEDDWSEYESVINVTAKVHITNERFTEAEIKEYNDINCTLACEAAVKAINEGVGQYIFLSTMSIYGIGDSKKPVVVDESTKPNPQNPYGKSKWKAEVGLNKIFQNNGNKQKTKLVIIRPPMVYGEGCKGNFQTLVKLAKICPVFPDYPNGRSMLFVDNLSEFMAQVIKNQMEGVFFPQDRKYVNTADMVAAIASANGEKIRKCKIFNPFVDIGKYAPGKVGRMVRKAFGTLVYDSEISKNDIFDYQKYGMEDGIRPEHKKRVLMLAHVSSMIDLFNMRNMEMLQKMGYEVHVAANFKVGNVSSAQRIEEFKKELEQKNIKWFQIDFERNVFHFGKNAKAYQQLKTLLSEKKYQFIHCHSPIGGVLGRLAAHKYHIPVIYTAHGFHFFQGAPKKNWLLFYPVEWLLSFWTDTLVTINREDYDRAKKHMHAKRTLYVPGVGVNLGDAKNNIEYSGEEKRIKKRKELGIPEDAFLIAQVAELTARKNQRTVITAVEKLNEPNIYYVMCGIGEKKEELEEQVRKGGMESRILFLGFRTDIDDILDCADCFVLSSYQEGLSVALMEAMTEGLPVVCGKIRGNVDLVENGVGGYLVAPGEESEYRKAFTKLYEMKQKEPHRFENMGQANQCKMKEFSKENVDKIMWEIYKNIGK